MLKEHERNTVFAGSSGHVVSGCRDGTPKIGGINLIKSQDAVCRGCGADLCDGFQIDHIKAFSKGGNSEISNLQLLCKKCNFSKRDMDWECFIKHAKSIVEHNKL